MKPVIVNFMSHQDGRSFEYGRARLLKSLDKHWHGDALALTPENLEYDSEVPFAFKPAAVMEAVKRGYTRIIWADSSVVLLKPPVRTMEYLEAHPVLFTPHRDPVQHSAGYWASDRCLSKHGLNRNEAMSVPTFVATILGFNLDREGSREFLRRWMEASLDGESFVGNYKKDTAPVSLDPRCRGHRHDQAAAGVINHRMGLPVAPFEEFVCYYAKKDTEWSLDFV